MGCGCSSNEEDRHHRENRKNRNNPTEPYDKWQQKMLVDIGTDPLAVIRDFPRMMVYVGTGTHHTDLPADCEAPSAATAGANEQAENPLAPPHSPQQQRGRSNGARGGRDGSSPKHPARGKSGKKQKPALTVDTSARAGDERDAAKPGVSPPYSPQLPPRAPNPAATSGQRPSQREPFRDDDAFAARMKRVRETVVLLSELCNERLTFGAAFEVAWDRLVAQSSNDGAAESEAASDYLATLLQQQQQQTDGGIAVLPPSGKRSRRPSIVLDVHQTLLNACVDSGMIVLADEAAPVTASATLRAMSGGSNVPPPPSRVSPAGASRTSRPGSAPVPAVQLPDANASVGLTADKAPADYGATATTAAANNTTSGKDKDGGDSPLKRKGRGRHAHEKDAAKSSVNSQPRVGGPLATPAGGTGAAAPAPGTSSRYVVRSATFHLMQFTTQGVMFFPVQRLKHVLWVPWSSHLQDISWTIHFNIKEATAADLIALKQHTLNALYNTASTVMTTEAAAGAAAMSNGVDVTLSDPSLQQAATVAVQAADHQNEAAERNADEFGAVASSILSDPATRPAAAAAGGSGGGATVSSGSAAPPAREQQQRSAGTNLGNEKKGKRRIIVVQHVQTARHYVEDADRKTTPRFELEWACAIRVDQETLQEAFAPFQHCAASREMTSSVLPNTAGNSSPPSPLRCSGPGEESAYAAAVASSSAQRPPSHDGSPGLSADPTAIIGAEGIHIAQQPALLQREVVAATVEVVAARVERPPHTMRMVNSTWRKRKEELAYVLDQQYKVDLEEAEELRTKEQP